MSWQNKKAQLTQNQMIKWGANAGSKHVSPSITGEKVARNDSGQFQSLRSVTQVAWLDRHRVPKPEGTKTWFQALPLIGAACQWYQLTHNVWLPISVLIVYFNVSGANVHLRSRWNCSGQAFRVTKNANFGNKKNRKLVPSVLWRCWLGGRKGIRPVKNRVVGCWRGYLSGARCRLAYSPADATATHCFLLQ